MDSDNPIKKQWIFVGLGNPGIKYEMTRHNMGYLVVKAFAAVHNLSLKEDKQMLAFTAKGEVLGVSIHLILPTTYMNENGQAVRKYLDYFKLSQQDLLIICDDVDLPFGQLRLKEKGSAGGHNGLKSIERHLGTSHYARLKVGIGRKLGPDQILSDYVLDTFTPEEREQLPSIMMKGAEAMQKLLTETISGVMNVVNKI